MTPAMGDVQHWVCRLCPAGYYCGYGQLPVRSDDHRHEWMVRPAMADWAYGDCGYGIVPQEWHHGPGYLPVTLPGDGCER